MSSERDDDPDDDGYDAHTDEPGKMIPSITVLGPGPYRPSRIDERNARIAEELRAAHRAKRKAEVAARAERKAKSEALNEPAPEQASRRTRLKTHPPQVVALVERLRFQGASFAQISERVTEAGYDLSVTQVKNILRAWPPGKGPKRLS